MMLSAWFWLPALMGTGQVQLDEQTTGYLNYANHFRAANLVQPSLLFDYTVDAKLGVFGMGLVQALLCLIGLGLWIGRIKTGRWLIPVLFVLATLLITPLSAPIWQALKPLQLAQFPWRVLSLQSLFAALLIGKIADGSPTRLYGMAMLLLVVMLARLPNERLWVNSADVTPEQLRLFEWFSGNIGTTIRAEYLPKTALPKPVTGPAVLGQTQAVALTGEMAAATQLSAGPTSQQWQITVNSPQAEIVLPLLYWQPWRASSVAQDGSTSAVMLAPNLGSGWVKATLPQGQQQLNLWLDKTPDQRGAEWVSVLTALGLAGLGLWQGRQRFDLRRMAMSALGVVIGIGLMQNVTALTPQTNAAFGDLQTLDFDGRPYPHRAPLQFWAADQPDTPPYTLLSAKITPSQVQAGQAFTLSLQWKDDLAPPQVQVIQELPSGVANADLASRIFRYARSVTPANTSSSQHTALPEAPSGPLLLKLAASDASGKALSATLLTGNPLGEFWLLGLNIAATQPAPEVKPTLREFANGLRLHELDWQQQDGDHVCIRPVWSSPHPIADALQVSIRIRNAANDEVATVDGQPHLGLSPTWSWLPDQMIRDSYCRVPIQNHLQAGDAYQIQLIWYRVSDQAAVGETTLSGARLPEMNGWHVLK
ncbi:MAG: hypothetical protein KIH69_015020 [Anaerolineae bacterium]|nr:hypothetical protein [Anaerolineae bacterium]